MLKVFVYWNLHKGLWSVKALEGPDKGKVILRAPKVILFKGVPKLSEKGRQRVLREGRKNVHAGIVGGLLEYSLTPEEPQGTLRWQEVTYNPYKGSQFVYKTTGEPWEGGSLVYMNDKKVYTPEVTGENVDILSRIKEIDLSFRHNKDHKEGVYYGQ